ncbi:MAG: O-antigen ligase family protein, partial [Candidatus Brocadiia bacterium]|nr:O-antigen ligase family protein [Candidatus Brocadiia bacterium]
RWVGPPAGPLAGVLDKVVPILVLAALLTHPTQVTLRQWARALSGAVGFGRGLTARIPAGHVTVSDFLLVAAFLLWAFLAWRRGRARQALRLYPLGVAALLACAVLSTLTPLESSAAATSRSYNAFLALGRFARVATIFVCGLGVLADYLSRQAWRDRLMAAFFVAAALCVAIGLVEYLQLRPPSPQAGRAGAIMSPMDVDAMFGFEGVAPGPHTGIGASSSRNVLGAWLTMVLPLAWAVFLFGRRPAVRGVCCALSVAGGLLLLSGGLWAAALLAVLALSFVRGRRAFVATAVGMLALYGIVFSFAPQRHGHVLLDSVLLHKRADRFRTLPPRPCHLPLAPGGKGAASPDPWQQKFVQWQPALLAFASRPFFGFGIGNYEGNVGAFYSRPTHPDYNPAGSYNMDWPPGGILMEKDATPFYAAWLVETGLVGLLGFAWMVMGFLRRAAHTLPRRHAGDDLARALKLGAIAALGAVCLGGLFTDYWVRGVGTALTVVLALCAAELPEQEEIFPASEEVTRI